MSGLPSGIVTFLFTDIEGSSRLWERDRAAMARAAARHDALLATAIASHEGVLYKHVGDMVQAAFASAVSAVAAAVAAQRALADEPWPVTGPLRVRMAIHRGEAAPNAAGDYHQVACLNRLARLMSAGYGGQVLLSAAVRQATEEDLPEGVTLRDLGRHRLRDLLDPEQISQLVIAGLPADFPPLKTLEGHPTNLPTLSTTLLGREVELADIASLLGSDGPRLVTLIGPGGVGKTHLALQAAANALDEYPDGVWLVRLGEVTDLGMIVPTVAAALGIREGGGLTMSEALLHWLDDKQILLVLDNLEQIVAGAPAIADILASSPRLRVLATSRRRLGIGGERIVPVQPLAVTESEVGSRRSDDAGVIPRISPPPPSVHRPPASVQLFVERARDVSPGFALEERNAPLIAAICAQLDGLPLAIELAAAQLRARTLAELLSDLERRFELLVGGKREALSHQQSLAATIAWSYERLDAQTQRVARLLSTFAGGWSRAASEAVARELDDVPGRLDSLVEQSLVRRSTVLNDVSRWSMLESIRAFARERLETSGEASLAYERHADWCLTFAAEANEHLDGPRQEEWLARLDLEDDNARAALQWWTEEGKPDRVLALATALAPHWQTRGRLSEGRRWLETALGDGRDLSSERLRATIEAGILAQMQGDYGGAERWYTESLDMARRIGDRGRETAMLNNLGAIALERGDPQAAEARFAQSLALAEDRGDDQRRALALGNLAAVAQFRGDLTLALRRCTESLAIWRELGDTRRIAELLLSILFLLANEPEQRDRARAVGEEGLRLFRALGDIRGEALTLSGLGLVASGEGDLDRAAMLHAESLRLAQQVEDRATEARALGSLGLVELDRGRLDRAADLLGRGLQAVHELGDLDGAASALEALAAVHAARGDDERAARLRGATDALRMRIGAPVPAELRQRYATLSGTLTQRLHERFAPLLQEGAALSLADAVAAALTERTSSGDALAASLRELDVLLQSTAASAPGEVGGI